MTHNTYLLCGLSESSSTLMMLAHNGEDTSEVSRRQTGVKIRSADKTAHGYTCSPNIKTYIAKL